MDAMVEARYTKCVVVKCPTRALTRGACFSIVAADGWCRVVIATSSASQVSLFINFFGLACVTLCTVRGVRVTDPVRPWSIRVCATIFTWIIGTQTDVRRVSHRPTLGVCHTNLG
jgi:hypothetical protein